ncbi:hypothetical protein PG996_009752 [Apiospora saccharicola]|uniref:Uncharacterized protein n=1 Tax=Apiospora saccharicola TaxID=335842 RepID=A0ABR1ULN2_9PEZI
MAGYSYHDHWQDDDDGRDGLFNFEQYYTFPSRSKNHHAGSQGIFHRLLKRQYRQVDDSCQYASKKQQLTSKSSKSLSQSKNRQRGGTADLRSDQQPCQAVLQQGSPTTPPTAMRAFSSSNNLGTRHKQCNPGQSHRRSSGVGGTPSTTSPAATTANQQQQQPNLFSRLLRRAQSKKSLKHAQPGTAVEEEHHTVPSLPATKDLGNNIAAREGDGQKTATMERKSTLRLKKSIRSRFRGAEQLPQQPEPTETKKTPAVYVPRHAAADFSRTAVPNPDATARIFASFDEGRRHPSSSSNAPASPTLLRPRTSPGHQHNPPDDDGEDYFQQPQKPLQLLQRQQSNYHAKRRSWAPGHSESRSNRFSFASYNAEADYTTAPPPLSPSAAASSPVDASDEKTPLRPGSSSGDQSANEQQRPRQSQRHSYRLVPDPHDAVIDEETDFQRFLNKAAEEDRQYRQDLWRTLSQRTRAVGLAGLLPPPEPDLDLQALLGGADWNTKQPGKELGKQDKRASNSHRKRASMISYRSQTDRQGKLPQELVPTVPIIVDTKVVRRKPSVTKRVQEYFRPEALANLRD